MILFSQFIGTWYFLYHLPHEHDDNFECPINKFDVPVGNRSKLVIHSYNKG
jgi:hypothetical protein